MWNTIHDAASCTHLQHTVTSIAVCHSLAIASQSVTTACILQPRAFLLHHPSFRETHLAPPLFAPKTFTCSPKRAVSLTDCQIRTLPGVYQLQSLTLPLPSQPPNNSPSQFFFVPRSLQIRTQTTFKPSTRTQDEAPSGRCRRGLRRHPCFLSHHQSTPDYHFLFHRHLYGSRPGGSSHILQPLLQHYP